MEHRRLNYSFLPGTQKVPVSEALRLRVELMKTLSIKTTQYYYRKRKGIVNIPFHLKQSIEQTFAKFGVDPSEVWHITPCDDERSETHCARIANS